MAEGRAGYSLNSAEWLQQWLQIEGSGDTEQQGGHFTGDCPVVSGL